MQHQPTTITRYYIKLSTRWKLKQSTSRKYFQLRESVLRPNHQRKTKNKRPSPKHLMLPSSLINTRVRMDPLHQDIILHQDRTRKHSQSTTRSRSLYRNQCNSTITMVRWTRTIHSLLKNQQANSSAYSKHLWRRHFHRPGRWGWGLGKSDTSRPLWPPVNGIRGRI